ncbi:MAG: ABC transporter ATP-binding protein [Deltaproteobacteria bacterium]|nr:MAG: ABC transporter ATP-binding protein [Deltaproteobacteria bacterium]
MILQVTDLEVFYGNIQALHGISFNVEEGETVTIIGSNGAGKSTTLLTIAGLLKPGKGEIKYLGTSTKTLPADRIVRRGISLCPEGRRIFSSLTVYENLIMGAVQRRDRKKIRADVKWVLSLFPDLNSRLDQAGGTLSGGQQQMLAIGRSLMSRPKLLILDEPSLGLAPVLVNQIFNVIATLKNDGTTVLLVEQNARRALEIADRGYVIETGRITMEGSSTFLKSNDQVKSAYLGG